MKPTPPTQAQIEAWLQDRRSIRRFKPQPVDEAAITRMISMAITAPSASNNQPWRFFVVRDRTAIESMAHAVQTVIDRIAVHIDPGFEAAFREYGDYFTRFLTAPVVIVPACRAIAVLSNLAAPSLEAADRRQIERTEEISGIDSTAMAIQNLLLYAGALGLGASAMTGPLVAEDALKKILGIPAGWRIAAVVPVGVPDESPNPPGRKPVELVIRWVEPDPDSRQKENR